MSNNALSELFDNPDAMKRIAEMAGELMGSPGAPAAPPPTGAVPPPPPDPAAELMQKAVPLLSTIARSGHNAIDPDRLRLLTALKPFLSVSAAVQLDHAARLLSMAHMTRTAASQFLSQDAPPKEV